MKTLSDRQITIVVLIVAAVLVLASAFQGSRGIWQPDEGYYVGTAVTMIKNGNLLIPKLGEELFLEKPPMLYWGIIAGIKTFGQTELACRLFNAACFALTAALTSLLYFSLFGKKLNAFVCALIYATMAVPFTAANFVTPDTPLTLWTTASILCFWKSLNTDSQYRNFFKMLLYISLGLGFLTKGPAVFVPCAGMFVYLLLTGQTKKFFFTIRTLPGILLFIIIGLGWYFYVSAKVPGAAAYFFDNQIWGRLVTEKYQRNPEPLKAFIYIPVLLLGSFPWSAIWLEKTEQLKTTILSPNWWKNLPQHPRKLFLLTVFFIPLLVFSLASSRLPLYSLPLFPILAVVASSLLTNKTQLLLQNIKIKAFVKPVVLITLWILLLLFSRLALAHLHNSEKDARSLWIELKPYIPKGKYEIVTLDRRADGLLFYGAQEVENVTRKDDPYPTFSMPEKFETELATISRDNYIHLFIIDSKRELEIVLNVLKKHNIEMPTIKLEHEKWLLIVNPEKIS
jgi:4-amino-4-deoxy-L-arabinose transferase-like glycosyltransferase